MRQSWVVIQHQHIMKAPFSCTKRNCVLINYDYTHQNNVFADFNALKPNATVFPNSLSALLLHLLQTHDGQKSYTISCNAHSKHKHLSL